MGLFIFSCGKGPIDNTVEINNNDDDNSFQANLELTINSKNISVVSDKIVKDDLGDEAAKFFELSQNNNYLYELVYYKDRICWKVEYVNHWGTSDENSYVFILDAMTGEKVDYQEYIRWWCEKYNIESDN